MSNGNDDWEDVPKKKAGAATATADSDWEDVPTDETEPVEPVEPTEEEYPGLTEKGLENIRQGAKARGLTKFEKERPQIPEYYGLTPGNISKNVYEGAKGMVGTAAQGLYDIGFGEVNPQTGEIEHHLTSGGLLTGAHPLDLLNAMTRKYYADPAIAEWDKGNEIGGLVGAGHKLAAAVPLVGPWAAGLGEQAGRGDIGGAAGQALGAFAGGELMGETPRLAKSVGAKVLFNTPMTNKGKIEQAVRQLLSVRPPGVNETEYRLRVEQAVRDLQDVAIRNRILTPRDGRNAVNDRINQIERPIGDHLAGVNLQVFPDQYLPMVNEYMDAELANIPGALTAKEKMAAKQKVLDYLTGHDPMNPDAPKMGEDLEGNRRRLNDDADKYYKSDTAGKNSIDVSDATAIAQRAAADAIRDYLYGKDGQVGFLERSGLKAFDDMGRQISFRDVRRRVGNLIEIRNHLEKAIVRAEKTGNWNVFSEVGKGPSLAAGGAGALYGAMKGHPVEGVVAGEAAKAWGKYRNPTNINELTARAFANLRKTAPGTTPAITVQRPGQIAPPQFPSGQGAIPPSLAFNPVQGPPPAPGPFQFGVPPGGGPQAGGPSTAPAGSLWQQQVPPGLPPLETGESRFTPEQLPTPPIKPITGTQLNLNLPEPRHELFNLPQTPRVPVPPEGPGQFPGGQGALPEGEIQGPARDIRRNPKTGRMEMFPPKTMQTTGAEYLRVGNTFIDDKGDPRRIVEITKQGTIKTQDDTPRTYPGGEIQHQGEINSMQSRIAQGGRFHPAPGEEELPPREEEPKKKEDERIDLGEIGGVRPEIEIPKTSSQGAAPTPSAPDLNEYLRLVERNGGEEETARDYWDGLDEDERQDALDEQRDIARRRPPRSEGPLSVEDAIERLRQGAETDPNEVYDRYEVRPPGEMTLQQFGQGGPTFMLNDGSTLQGGPGVMSHMQLARKVGYSLLNDANAIRLAGMDAYETHVMPSDAQLAQLKRLSDEEGGKTVAWSLYPEEEKNYSDDADWNLAAQGEGSFMQFRRALDKQYGGRFRPNDLHASTRVPGAVGAEDAHTKPMFLDWSSINYGDLPERLLNAVKDFPDIKGMFNKEELKNPVKALNKYVDHLADNLVWLYKQIPKELRDVTKLWYESVNRMTKQDHEEYGYTPLQSSGVIAVLSPKMDWFMNRSMSKRIQSIYRNMQNAPWTPEMEAKARELAYTETRLKVTAAIKKLKGARGLTPDVIEQAKTFADRNQRKAAFDLLNRATKSDLKIPDKTVEPLTKNIRGKTLAELSDPYDAGAWVRIYDETYNNPAYQEIAPDGTILGNFKNDDGSEARIGWTGFDAIAKAIRILRDGSRENVSRQLGSAHKVRNFHNNIIDTFSPRGDITADTHAVAAAHLSPFSAQSLQVNRNFSGPPKSDPMGVYGTYVLNAEAYRRATARVNAELGENLRPGQMQSISWEGIRDLFPDKFKTDANKTKIENIWKAHRRGKITLDQARQQILDAAGGKIPIPDWYERWKALKETPQE